MAFDMKKFMAVGTKVRINEPMDVPEYSAWDDDHGRTSAALKKRLQGMFFRGDRKLVAEIVYVAKESERERLRRKGLVKIRIKDQAGSMLTITADPKTLVPCN
ncbi:MAG TPA: hypothetical protein PL151_17285 [Phycisphaerae bacterium]|nr:hypothetical protein [Phycisphaerae bacterium]HOJ76205.1 hypothetical protein [Phycisphaerae bacterium]HOM53583.1 hypothetical protein [Phycisphaerae bacterium]HON68089.1 hypothetical protein [Phycisphaerae bacterium]HOQ84556.1 hypothetical protein [Phycisphaerae bacterium]